MKRVQIGAFREVLAHSSPLVFSFVPRSHGLAGSEVDTVGEVRARRSWRAIPAPWSHVRLSRAASGGVERTRHDGVDEDLSGVPGRHILCRSETRFVV